MKPCAPPLPRTLQKRSTAAWRCTEIVGNLFYGVSLGSVLLLAALGLAITFGLMGIINMAHGELLMIGAYATYVVPAAVPQVPARRARLVPARRAAGRLPARRRWSAWCSSAR